MSKTWHEPRRKLSSCMMKSKSAKIKWKNDIFCLQLLLIHSIWYDFWELRVIIVRCSSTDRLVKFELVFWVELLLCLNTEVDCWFWFGFKWLNSPSLSPPLDVARRKRSRDSLKLGPLSIVCCCCCWREKKQIYWSIHNLANMCHTLSFWVFFTFLTC